MRFLGRTGTNCQVCHLRQRPAGAMHAFTRPITGWVARQAGRRSRALRAQARGAWHRADAHHREAGVRTLRLFNRARASLLAPATRLEEGCARSIDKPPGRRDPGVVVLGRLAPPCVRPGTVICSRVARRQPARNTCSGSWVYRRLPGGGTCPSRRQPYRRYWEFGSSQPRRLGGCR